LTVSERSIRIKVAGEIYEVIHKIERQAIEKGQPVPTEFINGMWLAAAIAEERRKDRD
jgi:hypothetical protein